MPISYSYDQAAGVLETVLSGEIRLADVEAFLREAQAQPWFPAPSINDASAVHPSIPTTEVRAIAELLRAIGPRLSGVPFAVIVSSPVLFGLVRMVELLVDDIALIKPFHDRERARAWLANPYAES